MSRLTFFGWLKLEIIRLSGRKTESIHKLALEAQRGNSRLAEPLLLYAMETDATTRLMSFTTDKQLIQAYREVLEICGDESILRMSKEQRDKLPWNYKKLLENWRAAEGKVQQIASSKRMRLERSLQLKNEKGVSNAHIYQTLGLNPGNTNAYFKHQDISKLSLENATRIMKYLYML